MEPVKIKVGDSEVTIYEVKNNGDWKSYCLCWRQGSDRVRRTLSDFEEAKREAERIARDLALGDTEITQISGKQLRYYQQCETALNGTPLHVAVQFYLKAHGEEAAPESRSMESVLESFLATLAESGKSERHISTLRSNLTRFVASLPDRSIGEISSQEVETFLAQPDWSLRTRYNQLLSLKIFFNYARRKGWVADTATPADKAETIQYEQKPPEIYTPEELSKLLHAVPLDGIPFIALGAFGGLRAKEIQRLIWADIDRSNKVIRLDRSKTKTKRRRLVPICDAMEAWLAKLDASNKMGFQKVVPGANPYKQYLQKAVADSGVSWKPNALRHSFVSYHLALEQNPAKTAFISGHSPQEAEETYKELVTKEQAEAWFNVLPTE